MRLLGLKNAMGWFSRMGMGLSCLICAGLLSAGLLSVGAAQAQSPVDASLARHQAETIYIPAYSHILTEENEKHPLASTLVVHNVDPERSITLTGVRYYDHAGKVVRDFKAENLVLAPFASANFTTFKRDDEGGVGANFIVEWEAASPALSPIAEAVVVGGGGTLGISFTTRGRAIARR